MDRIRIRGGKTLKGEIRISGAKNAALPLMATALLTDAEVRLDGVPDLADITTMTNLLAQHGVEVTTKLSGKERSVTVCGRNITDTTAPYDLVRKMRASVLVLGPLIARHGQARVSLPGGCAIGTRPVDLHIKGLQQLGAEIDLKEGYVYARAPNDLHGVHIQFPFVSVGATENLMMAACLAKGPTTLDNAAMEPEITDLGHCLQAMGATIIVERGYMTAAVDRLRGARIVMDLVTVTGTENLMMAAALAEGETLIENAAREPEVVDLARCLIAMGAKIEGAGSDVITIDGVEALHGALHRVMPDRIEAVVHIRPIGLDVLDEPTRDALGTTLREVGGLSTRAIAHAFLVPEPTLAQRIVRAKRTLAEAKVPFELPRGPERAARLESVQEHDIVADLTHRHVPVAGVRELFGQLGQFVVVRGEHRLAPHGVVQVPGHRPRDGDAVERGGAAADLVQQHEGAARGAVQDRAGLAHLDHERGLAPREVVRRAHPGEQPIHDSDLGGLTGDKAAHLSEDHDEADLAQNGALARHVGPGDEIHPVGAIEPHVVGNECLARHQALENRVARPPQRDLEPVVHDGTDVAVRHRHVGERGPDIEPGQHAGGALDAGYGRSDPLAEPAEELGFASGDAIFRPEHFGLVFLELGGHKPLGRRQSLAALVVGRDLGEVRIGDLEVVPEHLVEPHFERGNAGTVPLPLLDRGDPLFAPVAQGPELVELGIITRTNHSAFGEQGRGSVGEGGGEVGVEIFEQIEILEKGGQAVRRSGGQ